MSTPSFEPEPPFELVAEFPDGEKTSAVFNDVPTRIVDVSHAYRLAAEYARVSGAVVRVYHRNADGSLSLLGTRR